MVHNLGVYLKDHLNYITSFNIVKGFLNLEFSDQFWFDALDFSFLKNFEINESKDQNIVIEFSSKFRFQNDFVFPKNARCFLAASRC